MCAVAGAGWLGLSTYISHLLHFPPVAMVSYDSALVVLACTLAGAFDRAPFTPLPSFNATATDSCSATTCHRECHSLDATIHPLHIFVPWAITLATVLGLSMPTMLLRSKSKERGLCVFACNLFRLLCLILAAVCVSAPPSVCYTLTVHSCVRLLLQLDVSRTLLGGVWWWRLRFLSVGLILALQLSVGPAISVVQWSPSVQDSTLHCAYLSHLIGCIVPEAVLCAVWHCLFWTLGRTHIKDH